MIETCVDIASHIISDRGCRIPKSYADSFTLLHEEGFLEKELLERMESVAKFKNIVVHHYDKVDELIVVSILKKHLDEFLQCRDAILKLLR